MGIKAKKKTCKGCGNLTYIWARGMCKSCDRQANPHKYGIKKTPKPLKRVPIKKGSTARHKANKSAERVAMEAFWETKKDKQGRVFCEECGKQIKYDPSHCAHILSKGAFPSLRCVLDNLMALCFGCHTIYDCQDRTSMRIWPEIKERILKLKNLNSVK